MGTQVVKVRRDALEACMTCPLCNKLFKDATTISICLHTFCRKCIYEKLSDEEVDSCPVCNIDLGCLPVEKLRPDHNLQDIRAKIFPFKRRKTADPPEVPPSVSPPVKRKERSLSSLVSTPKVWMQTGLTGKRTKAIARKASSLKGCSFGVGDQTQKEDDNEDDHPDSPVADPSNEETPNKDTENDVELTGGKVDLWTPLNCLVEAANRTKSYKFNSQGQSLTKLDSMKGNEDELYMSGAKARAKGKAESPTALDGERYVLKSKTKENGHKTRIVDEKSGKVLAAGPVKRRRVRPAGRKRDASEEVYMVDASTAKCNNRNGPIWFSLVASEDQKGDVSLPQISTCYLRIKDGNVPVSYIQKYLVKKLGLTSEIEVEIMCRGHPVLPTLQLHNLVDLWFRTASTSKKVPTSVGSSAKDFVMVLSYCRKVQAIP